MRRRPRRRLPVLLCLAALLQACGVPVPEDKRDYVGYWKAPNMVLLIEADGTVAYERHEGRGRVSVNGPIQEFSGDDFKVGFWFLNTTFEVGRVPWFDGSRWRMTVDGVELVRCADAHCSEAVAGLEVEILEHGLFSPRRADDTRPIVEATSLVPAAVGQGFGVRFLLDAPEGSTPTLTFRWDVPPMRNPETGEVVDHVTGGGPVSPGERWVAWDFGEQWHLVPGQWSLRILQGSQVLARKTFHVYRPDAAGEPRVADSR